MMAYLALGFAVWLMLRVTTGRGAALELVATLLFWPLVLMLALAIWLACWAVSVREWIRERWRK